MAGQFNKKLYLPMILGVLVNPINTSIIAVALIPIGKAFGVSPSITAWLVTSLYLTTSIGQPIVGKLVDIFGPRRLYLIGNVIVMLGGLAVLLAPGFWWLVAARVLIGIGTCAGYPSAMHIIRSEGERTKSDQSGSILSFIAIGMRSVTVFGPVLGGALISLAGWKAPFIINIPLSIICYLFGSIRYPKFVKDPGNSVKLDFFGMILYTGMMITLLLFLMDPGFDTIVYAFSSVVLLAAFILFERKKRQPFIDVKLLARNKALINTYIRTFLMATALYCFIYGYSQWLQDGRQLSPGLSGFMLFPTMAIAILAAIIYGKGKNLYFLVIFSNVVLVVSSILIVTLSNQSPLGLLLIIALLAGLPQGVVTLVNQNAVYLQADPDNLAASTGLLLTFQYTGAILAASINGLFFGEQANLSGLHDIGIFMIIISVILLVITLADPALKKFRQ